MTFDPKGTEPGLAATAQEKINIIHLKCRSERCNSMQATEIVQPVNMENAGAPHNRVYRCVKCGVTWSASVGGYVSF